MAYVYGQKKRTGNSKTGYIDRRLRETDCQISPKELAAEVLKEMPELTEGQDKDKVYQKVKALVFSRRAVIAKKEALEKAKAGQPDVTAEMV
jgi:hypothetical protein